MNSPIFKIDEFITGDKFRLMCDVDTEKDPAWLNKINTHPNKILTVFIQTHELKNVIPIISNCLDKKFIIVSHNSDGQLDYLCTGRWFDYQWNQKSNIIYWYGQNMNITELNVYPIPIALENAYIFKPEVKMHKMIKLMNVPKQNKIFMCFNEGTNPPQRKTAYEIFSNKPWIVSQKGYNNIGMIDSYFESLVHCQFVLCPEGNGIDTIRTWEALYLGCIPIVFRRPFTEWFAKKLPIIVIDNYGKITEEFLTKKLEEFNKQTFDYSILTEQYWKTEINNRRFCD